MLDEENRRLCHNQKCLEGQVTECAGLLDSYKKIITKYFLGFDKALLALGELKKDPLMVDLIGAGISC